MSKLQANGLEFEYDEFGAKNATPIVLIMGLYTQMTAWPEPFCEDLASSGYRVIRFDNRDVGLSSKLHGQKAPGIGRYFLSRWFGLPFKVPYGLRDMAQDTVGILDALQIPSAHVVGASMGGMIAQNLASLHSDRVRSLTSIMSSSGDPKLPGPSAAVRRVFFATKPGSEDKEAAIKRTMTILAAIGSSKYRRSEEEMRKLVTFNIERSLYPQGFIRQFAAILSDGSRVERLRSITVPALVIHGNDDGLIPVQCGIHTAECLAGSRLEIIDGLGHDLPTPLLGELADHIRKHVLAADQRT